MSYRMIVLPYNRMTGPMTVHSWCPTVLPYYRLFLRITVIRGFAGRGDYRGEGGVRGMQGGKREPESGSKRPFGVKIVLERVLRDSRKVHVVGQHEKRCGAGQHALTMRKRYLA